MTQIRVFLLDDHEVVRRGVRDLLESEGDIEVVGEASHRRRGDGAGSPPCSRTWRSSTSGCPMATASSVCRDLRSQLPTSPA